MTLEGKLNFQLKKLNQNNWKNLKNIIGHRGVKDLAPENTLDSILNAFDLGLNWVEIDVKVSKDNIPFLLHDDTLNRTTNGKGLANHKNYSDIKKLDAGIFFYKKPTKIYPPTLKEVLELVKNKKKSLNIELKPNNGFEKINVEKILQVMKEFSDVDVYYSSFDLDSCILVKKNLPNCNCSFLVDNFEKYKIQDVIDICLKFDFFLCGTNIKNITKDVINIFSKNKIFISVYSEKNINITEAINLWNIGTKTIFSDDPTELLKI